jgi:hypothetical protein
LGQEQSCRIGLRARRRAVQGRDLDKMNKQMDDSMTDPRSKLGAKGQAVQFIKLDKVVESERFGDS